MIIEHDSIDRFLLGGNDLSSTRAMLTPVLNIARLAVKYFGLSGESTRYVQSGLGTEVFVDSDLLLRIEKINNIDGETIFTMTLLGRLRGYVLSTPHFYYDEAQGIFMNYPLARLMEEAFTDAICKAEIKSRTSLRGTETDPQLKMNRLQLGFPRSDNTIWSQLNINSHKRRTRIW